MGKVVAGTVATKVPIWSPILQTYTFWVPISDGGGPHFTQIGSPFWQNLVSITCGFSACSWLIDSQKARKGIGFINKYKCVVCPCIIHGDSVSGCLSTIETLGKGKSFFASLLAPLLFRPSTFQWQVPGLWIEKRGNPALACETCPSPQIQLAVPPG